VNFILNEIDCLFSRHPFLLYPHFIDRWKKQDDGSSMGDNESEIMFIDDEENISKKKKKPDQVIF
jgi:hypothetical protein